MASSFSAVVRIYLGFVARRNLNGQKMDIYLLGLEAIIENRRLMCHKVSGSRTTKAPSVHSPECMATACGYQAARASESSNLMQRCTFGRFRRFVGTDSPEFMGSIRT
jgi:hypothetical protein